MQPIQQHADLKTVTCACCGKQLLLANTWQLHNSKGKEKRVCSDCLLAIGDIGFPLVRKAKCPTRSTEPRHSVPALSLAVLGGLCGFFIVAPFLAWLAAACYRLYLASPDIQLTVQAFAVLVCVVTPALYLAWQLLRCLVFVLRPLGSYRKPRSESGFLVGAPAYNRMVSAIEHAGPLTLAETTDIAALLFETQVAHAKNEKIWVEKMATAIIGRIDQEAHK